MFFLHAKELYFGETANLTEMTLADSSGMSVEVDRAKWTLEEYYKDNNLKHWGRNRGGRGGFSPPKFKVGGA